MNPLSGVLGEAWDIYRVHWRHLLTISFGFYLITAVVVFLLNLVGFAGALLGAIVQLFAMFLLQATLIKAVQDVQDGRADLSVEETVRSATPYIVPVAIASILAGIAITIGLFLVIVPGLILITIWAVIIPVIVIERSGAISAFRRSQDLVRGRGWHVFGTLVLVFLVMVVVNILLSAVILVFLPGALRSLFGTVISGTLIAPFLALVVTLVYYRLEAAFAGGPSSAYGAPDGPGGYGPSGDYGAPGDYDGPGDYGAPGSPTDSYGRPNAP